MRLSDKFKFFSMLLLSICVLLPEILIAAPRLSRAAEIRFETRLREVLDSINDQTTSELLAQVGGIPREVDKLTCNNNMPEFTPSDPELVLECPIYQDSIEKYNQINELLAAGPIDLRKNMNMLYQLIKRQMQARITYGSMDGLVDVANDISNEVDNVTPEEPDVEELADEFDEIGDTIADIADDVADMGEVGAGQSRGSMISRINGFITDLQNLEVSGSAQSVIIALVTELGRLKQAIQDNAQMGSRELNAMACIMPELFDFSAERLREFASLYSDTASALDDIANANYEEEEEDEEEEGEEEEDPEPTGMEAALDELADDIRGGIGGYQGRRGAAAAEVAQLEAEITQFRIDMIRTEKYRMIEEEINNIQRPVCNKIREYNDALNPQKLFYHLTQDFVDEAANTPALAAQFEGLRPAVLERQLVASSTAAQRVFAREEALPDLEVPEEIGNNCGGLYIDPLPPNNNACQPDSAEPAAAIFSSRSFSSYDLSLGGGGLPGTIGNIGGGTSGGGTLKPGGKPGGGKKGMVCKNYRCQKVGQVKKPKSTDKISKLLYKAAKKFMKTKKVRIQAAYKKAYGYELGS